MLNLLLLILKIIGFILAFIIVLLLVILFVPVRYKAKGSYKEKEFKANFDISYLLYIFFLRFSFDQKFSYTLRLLGIKINLDRIMKKKKSVKDDESSKKDSNENLKEDSSEDKENTEKKEASDTSSKEGLSSKKEKLDKILKVLADERTKLAFTECRTRIGKAVRSILPYKGRIYARIGLENAGTTGKILGIYKALYDYIGDVITFVPVFDSQEIYIEFDIKGRIRFATVLYHIVMIYFDKNCRRIIKMLIGKNKRRKEKV